jgi:hypothetical protein
MKDSRTHQQDTFLSLQAEIMEEDIITLLIVATDL